MHMKNYKKEEIKGIALSCTPTGKIKDIIHDGLNLSGYFKKGVSFIDSVDVESKNKASNFIERIKEEQATFNWEINISLDKKIEVMHFSGLLIEDNDLLIYGVKSPEDIEKFWEEIYHINTEQNNALRSIMKDLTRYKHDLKTSDAQYVQLTQLNNELTTTKRKLVKKNIQLEKALEEKEMLLKEIHHRVKNNLMVISSLLSLQSRYIKDKKALAVFKESQNRAKSMALIHEKLYRSTDLKRIDFGEYIRTFSAELYHSIVGDPRQVKLELNVEHVMLDINTSIPLGLIVNELITNSMKYAFPPGSKGKIKIDFYPQDDYFILNVSDDGIGIPEEVDVENTKSLGLQLVNSLTEQINGQLTVNRKDPTEFNIKFQEISF
ncbi:sensor histidine kinase [Methanobacterium alkalithermotolerans]|uniref:Sensor histidine kinase n=2 Tax=Methanobacterium alkalithermotolerans TaxID=2731220 RepID=A0A8T8K578_9EURY|nr:sensor histidine kinase [Methanobacterium alkalithermotolerans]